ncbi:MAG: Crp/Fnr family transcriptional regulator, partial [bacterium]|nr:Crp/Fnr family transcriptional regulator [bacterium]
TEEFVAFLQGTFASYRVVIKGKVSRTGRGIPANIWQAIDLDNTAFLKQVPIFAHLNEDELRAVAEMCEARHYHRNEVIAWQGNVEQDILFVKNGIVGVTRLLPGSQDETQNLAYLKEGQMLGEISLLQEQNVAAETTASALSEVDVLAISRDQFRAYLDRDRRAALELARVVLHRLLTTSERLVSFSGDTSLALVFGVGAQCGQTMLGTALTMTLAQVTQTRAVYSEHPDATLLADELGLPRAETYHRISGSYDVAVVNTASGLPGPVRTTLVMDQLIEDYANVVIGVPGRLDESINYMLEQASQLVILFSPEDGSAAELEALVKGLQGSLHPEKTNLFVVAN